MNGAERLVKCCVWPLDPENDPNGPTCLEAVPSARASRWMALCDAHELEWQGLLADLAGKGTTIAVEIGDRREIDSAQIGPTA